jgi:hypothetical protein
MSTTAGVSASDLAVRSIRIMADGDRADFEAVIHPNAVNREGDAEPPECRVGGPAGFYATALWLRTAFADLAYEIHHVVANGNLVAIHSTMSGRHVAPFAVYTADREDVRDHAVALAADRGRPRDRALGQPRRPRPGQATRLGPADSGVPLPDGPRQVPHQTGRRLTPHPLAPPADGFLDFVHQMSTSPAAYSSGAQSASCDPVG